MCRKRLMINASAYIERLKHSTFFKSVLWVAGGTAAAQFVGIITVPIVTRLYSPSDFGIFSVFSSFLGIGAQISTLRYSVTIPLAESEDTANDLIKLSLLTTSLLTILLSIILLFSTNHFGLWFSIPQARDYLWLIPLAFLGAGLYETFSAWAQREKNFVVIARTTLSRGVSSSAVKIALGYFHITPLGLLLGLLVSQWAGIGSLLCKYIAEQKHFLFAMSIRRIIHVAKRYYSFPVYQTWSRLLLALGAQLPAILMATFFGTQAAGLYGLANNLVNMPMNLIGTSVAKVYYAEIARYGKSRPDKILTLSTSILKKLFLVGIVPFIFIFIGGPHLFSFAFGQKWWDSGTYARFLSFVILTRFIATPIAHCFDVLERQPIQLFINVTRVALVILIFWLCRLLTFSPMTTVIIYSGLMTLFYILVLIIIIFSLRREIKERHR